MNNRHVISGKKDGREMKKNIVERMAGSNLRIAIHYHSRRQKLMLGYLCTRMRKLGWVDIRTITLSNLPFPV